MVASFFWIRILITLRPLISFRSFPISNCYVWRWWRRFFVWQFHCIHEWEMFYDIPAKKKRTTLGNFLVMKSVLKMKFCHNRCIILLFNVCKISRNLWCTLRSFSLDHIFRSFSGCIQTNKS